MLAVVRTTASTVRPGKTCVAARLNPLSLCGPTLALNVVLGRREYFDPARIAAVIRSE